MSSARAVVLSSRHFERLTTAQLRDAIAYADPDAIVATSPGARYRVRSTLPDAADLPTLAPSADEGGSGDGPTVHSAGSVGVVVDGGDDLLAAIPDLVSAGEIGADAGTYVLTDRLSLSVRPTELRAELSGIDEYREALGGGANSPGLPEPVTALTHLSTALPAGYYREWEGLTVRGIGPDRDARGGESADDPTVRVLTLGADGAVGTVDLRESALGLRAIRGVGEKRAKALRSGGYRSREAVAEADLPALADVESLGRDSVARIREHARAFVDGAVVRRGDEYFPGREPVFVDVETDGLSPSIVWLVGVLDREGEETYMSFLNRSPDEPGRALSAFLSWYLANAAGRPIVAYNGLSFDFPVIEEQIERHCPEYLEEWRDAWTFDPYAWAVSDGNAVLPGRTNRLEDVAAALGYESKSDGGEDRAGGVADDRAMPDAAALSGAEVARQYREYADGGPEPEWNALEAYCEDDVRALAAIFDALDEAERTAGGAAASGSVGAEVDTTQGQLGDFE